MANALALFNEAPPSLPANVSSFFEEHSNIPPKQTTPSLSFEGKTWAISLNGEKTKLMGKNGEGDEVPLSVMRVIILDWAKRRGRSFYEGSYDPAKPGVPSCWSDDGITPHESVKEKQASKCDGCPMSIKGSRTSDSGKQVTACSEHRMVVVVPAGKPDFQPLRLKLPVTSDYDGQSPEHEAAGWFAFKGYTDMLRSREVAHTCQIVTKMKFDPNTAWPKVLFSPDKYVAVDVVQGLIPVIQSDAVQGLLGGTWTPAGVDGKVIEHDAKEVAPEVKTPTPAKVAPKATPKVVPPTDDEGVEVQLPGSAPAPAPAKATPKATPAPAKATPKAQAAPAETPAASDGGGDLDSLLSEWGE